ncbi:hypothetical protein HNR44_001728 [Geomicrobium halophilum]|uniref:Uncharacterized protein n=1 Tax=Geomicrobium halophilum TaxID=549000 RepID=A0A841PLW3_9BACL|nr:hypothetical protein [Geomicrobium halophilum]
MFCEQIKLKSGEIYHYNNGCKMILFQLLYSTNALRLLKNVNAKKFYILQILSDENI